ncbi:MAG: FG-GAP-like repeat-containing protein, partial [Cyanobacteria bacterium P01_A01_bin.84]
NFSGINSKENSIATAKVTFTPQNWNQYQSVKVTGIADNKVDDNVTYELQAKAISNDKDYNGQTIPITITNQNIDEKVESVNSSRPDPTLPMVTLEGTNTTFTENAEGEAKVKVILDRPAPKDGLTVFLSLDRSTATWQQDFNINTNLFLNQSGTSNPFDKVKVDQKKVGKYSYPGFADLDGDKDLDLVVGNSKGTLKFYRNVGTEFIPFFREEVGSSNPFGSINIGNVKDGYSTPTFADIIDGDGKLDLVVGSADGKLFYSQNISDSKGIKFAPIQSLEINKINGVDGNKKFENSTPTFVDLDGDGDLDAVVGDADGTIRYFQNTGKNKTQTNIIEPILTALTGNNNPFNNIDVGDNSTPNLVDFDGDGDLDLFVGNKAGKISFYRNNGTATTPQFNLDTNIPTNNWSTGNNAVLQFVDIDGDNDLDGVIGGADGTLQYQQQYQAIIIPEGKTEAEIQLKTIDDKFKEDEEVVNLKLVDNAKYRVNTNQQENYLKTIKIKDDEKAGLLIKDAQGNPLSTLQFSTQENNQTPLKFFLELTSKPTANVEVSLYTTDENEGKLKKSDSPANTISLIFSQNNWNQPQEFTVVPQNDAVEDGTVAYGITYEVSSQDVAYNDTVDYKTVTTPANTQNGNSSRNRLLNITNQDDNDKAGFIITPLSQGKEGTQDAFSIKLNSQPLGDVVVTLTPQDRDFYFVTQKPGENFTVTFNAQNWDKEQTLQIQAVDDAEVEYLQRSAIAFQVSGEDESYNKAGAELKPLHVIILDEDKPTARIKAGKSASEVYSTPGYFVVELDRDLLQQGSL